MTDSHSRDTESVPTTTFLPDHLLAGGTNSIEAAATNDEADESGEKDEADATSEFCQSWRSHLAGSGRKRPF